MKYAFQHDGKAVILKAEDGSTVRVGPRHEKHDYVQGVEAGRVIGISKSGRWTNAKDYHDLYDKVSFGKCIECFNEEAYTRLTKSLVKDAVTSALEYDTWKTSAQLNGWEFNWSVVSALAVNLHYDSDKGVRVRVLSIENTEHETIG